MNYPSINIFESKRSKRGKKIIYILEHFDDTGRRTFISPFYDDVLVKNYLQPYLERGHGLTSEITTELSMFNPSFNGYGKCGWVEIKTGDREHGSSREIANNKIMDFAWHILDEERKASLTWNRIIFPQAKT